MADITQSQDDELEDDLEQGSKTVERIGLLAGPALAAAAYRRYRERAGRITGQLPGYETEIGEEFVAIVKGEAGMHEFLETKSVFGFATA